MLYNFYCTPVLSTPYNATNHDYKGFSPDEIHYDAVDKSVKLAQLIGGDGFDDVAHGELSEQ